jgi:hypothetical protein
MRRSWIVVGAGAGALVVIGAMVLVLSGGPAGSGSVSLGGPVALAAERTARMPGERMTMIEKVTSPGSTFTMHGGGVFDGHTGLGQMSFQISGGGAMDGSVREISVGSAPSTMVLYMQMPQLASKLPAGKSWIRMDMQELGKKAGVDLSSLDSMNQSPTASLQRLEAMGDVHEVGVERVGGQLLTHYAGDEDFSRLPDVVPASQRGAASKLAQFLEKQTGETRIPEDVWIDRKGMIRRVREQLQLKTTDANGNAVTLGEDMTIGLSDFRGHSGIQLPPDDQVVDITSLGG